MKTTLTRVIALTLTLMLGACQDEQASPISVESPTLPSLAQGVAGRTYEVSGEGVHYFTTAAIHAQEPSATGMTQRSSDVIRLTGDLDGWILYHPTTVFDYAAGTMVNTGTQLFSGTVLGSQPVILHDDNFRFEVELETGATRGEVYLGRSDDAPHRGLWFECDLDVVGTGLTDEGDGAVSYTGSCTAFGRASLPGAG